MAARPRLTNNSVASLENQSAVLEDIFDKNSNKQKEKDKLKRKKSEKVLSDKKKQKVSKKPAAAAGAPLFEPVIDPGYAQLSDMEFDEGDSETWSDVQRREEMDQFEEVSDWGDAGSHVDLQHGDIHHVSEEEDGESQISAPDPSLPIPKQPVELEEITAKGALADFLREQLAEVKECDKVTPKLSGGVARIIDKYLKDSYYTADMEKLCKKYPKVENVANMEVPKLDTEVFTLLQQNFRNMDQSIQSIQKGVVSTMAALSPVLEKVMVKSEDDPELAELGINIADSLKLLSFTLNTLSGRRRELLKPCLAPAYVRILTKEHETTPQWLFGGDLLTTTKKCEAAKRIGQKVLKSKEQPAQPRARSATQKRFRAPFVPQQQGVMRPQFPQQQYAQGRFPAPQNFNQSYPYQPLETGVPSGFPRPYRPRYQSQGYQQGNQQHQQQNFPKKLK